jgi:ABC-type arginine transport system permease subunit
MRKLLLIIVLFGCNPVKQVLNDKAKFDEVAKEVIRQGYCANDTLIIVKSDTLVKVDSLIEVISDTTIINDTAYITKWETRNFTKTLTIHDTLRSVIVDNARVRQLQSDVDKITKQSEQHKQNATNRLYWFIIACAIILFLILYKIR